MSINKLLISVFTLLIFLLGSLFGALMWLSDTREKIAATEHRRYASFILADELRQSSDDLTKMARLYVSTGEEQYADYFEEIAQVRSGATERPIDYSLVYWDLVIGEGGERPRPDGGIVSLKDLMIQQGFSLLEFSKLTEAENHSDKLVRMELIAINAVKGRFEDGRGGFSRTGKPNLELAQSIMFGNDYLKAKARIMRPINDFFILLDARTTQEVETLRHLGHRLMMASLLISLAALILSITSIFIMRRKILKPLSLVSHATKKVGNGNYEHRIDHKSEDEVGQLVTAFNDMVTSTRVSIENLNASNKALTENQEELEREKLLSENLLLNILPSVIAQRLRNGETTIADEFQEVSVMFADLVKFTQLSEQLGPRELVSLLNDIFALFDQRLDEFGLEKIKTIGDCYMVVSGIPEPVADHAQRIGSFALAARDDFSRFVTTRGLDINIRIGIHSGTAVAGVVGTKKFAYDLWGDVVNVASRMESSGTPGKIHVSDAFKTRLQDSYTFDSQGEIEIKGKGAMHTHFLKGTRYQQHDS